MRLVLYRGKWCAYVGRGKRYSLRTADRALAEERLANLKADQTRKTGTVGQLVDSYIIEKKNKWLGWLWVSAKPFWENVRPESITRELCREYTKKREVSDETIRKEIGLVRAACRYYNVHHGSVFELPPPSPPKERYLTREEFNRLLDSASNPHMKTFLMIAISTAARKSAILELTWNKVDFKTRMVDFGRGKGNKGRSTVPMTEDLYKTLLEAFRIRTSDYVVEHGGDRIKDVKNGFKAACRRAGLKGVTPHTLRHSAASWMAMDGVSMDEIAKLLGHTSPSITYRVYAKFSPDHLKKAINSLSLNR